MLKFLKWVKSAFWVGISLLLLAPLVILAVQQQQEPPSWNHVVHEPPPNVDRSSAATAITKSRLSAVKVRSTTLNFFEGSSTTTGTYFKVKDRHYIITVHHGIIGPCWLLDVVHEGTQVECKKYIKLDELRDYAIIELEEPFPNRKPILIPHDLPHGAQWRHSYSILNKIIYTGYPNTIGPLTLRGDVVGYASNEQIYIFSHAYGGASGSGVFTQSGKYIGYVTAIDVGVTDWGIDILENIVLVAPAFNVDWNIVLD